jgi:phage terminase large subunit-like protein
MKLKIEYDLSYNPIQEYFEWIEENRKNGKWVVSQKVYKVYRHIIKFTNDPDSEWEYDSAKANHAIEFVENYCKHSKGKLGGKPFILELWQKALVAATFGIVHKIDRTRKYREVLLVVARKNGKSTLASAIGLYMQVADGEPGAEVYACATKKDQAKIIWLEAKRMVKKSSVLLKRIKTLVAELVADFNDSFFRPLGRDSDSLDGLNVHCALLDEIHAWTDDNLYDVIVDGTTARDEPLVFITTTAGTVREHIYDIKYDEAERVINGFEDENGYHDDHFLPIIYELDNRKEWIDESSWIKANPGLGTIKKLDQLANKVKKAIANSRLVKNLLCKDFNIPETTSEAWLTFEQANNTETFDTTVLKPRYGIGGTDLSSTTDLTAAKVIFKVPNDEHVYVQQMYWIPEDLVEKRVREDKIPYDIWIDQELIRTCPGNKIHPKYVTEWFLEIQTKYDIYIPWIGYDAWSAAYWVEEMQQNFGKESMIPVRQGKQTLTSPMKILGADLESNMVIYNNNPIDKWCLCNTAIEVDKNDNIQPIKTSNPRKRIDGTAALLDAYVVLHEKMNEYLSLI